MFWKVLFVDHDDKKLPSMNTIIILKVVCIIRKQFC